MKNLDSDRYWEINLLARCAHLYFAENKSQLDIAKTLDLTRSKVSRYMKRIVDEGLVEISFNFPPLPEIAARLCLKFGLRDAVVVPTGEQNQLKADIGQAAARYFERIVGDGAEIGISCGVTLYEMVRQIRETSARDLNIYPLAADTSFESVDIIPNTLVGMLVAKLRPHAIGYALPAQIVEKPIDVLKRRRAILSHPRIKAIFEKSKQVDIAFIGVGTIKNGVPGFCMIAEDYGLYCEDIVRTTDAIAEYNYSLIDTHGKELTGKPELKLNAKFREVINRIICVPLATLQTLASKQGKLIICVAGGEEKVLGINAVLKGRLANVLITDFSTAKALLERVEQAAPEHQTTK